MYIEELLTTYAGGLFHWRMEGGTMRKYRMALIFRGSKISRKAVFDNFVEIFWRKQRPGTIIWAEHINAQLLTRSSIAVRILSDAR